jgi:flagellar biosynthesis GTPase FlhF
LPLGESIAKLVEKFDLTATPFPMVDKSDSTRAERRSQLQQFCNFDYWKDHLIKTSGEVLPSDHDEPIDDTSLVNESNPMPALVEREKFRAADEQRKAADAEILRAEEEKKRLEEAERVQREVNTRQLEDLERAEKSLAEMKAKEQEELLRAAALETQQKSELEAVKAAALERQVVVSPPKSQPNAAVWPTTLSLNQPIRQGNIDETSTSSSSKPVGDTRLMPSTSGKTYVEVVKMGDYLRVCYTRKLKF